jgi:hypothetical protein
MSRDTKKIQSKCIQTRLTSEDELIEYRLMYPITHQFKWHLELQEPDEHDFVQKIKNKAGKECVFYVKTSRDFSTIRKSMYLIMIKSLDFKIKHDQNKKISLVDSYSNL